MESVGVADTYNCDANLFCRSVARHPASSGAPPRWLVLNDRNEDAERSLKNMLGEKEGQKKCEGILEAANKERQENVSYKNMLTPGHAQFHPTVITVMDQINQALTGYGGTYSVSSHYTTLRGCPLTQETAVSVYGPQIFALLGYGVIKSEIQTQANLASYFLLMTFAWLLIDAVGRRTVLLGGSGALIICFLLLSLFGGLAMNRQQLGIPVNAVAIPGSVSVFLATGAFGIGWLATIWSVLCISPFPGTSMDYVLTVGWADSHRDLPNNGTRTGDSNIGNHMGLG